MGLLRRMMGPTPGEMVADVLQREVVPLEGTNMSMFHTLIPSFWAENNLGAYSNGYIPGTAQLTGQVWVADRCVQMNAQQIASMPLEHHGGFEPAWVSNPDPNMFPNGIGDALFAIVDQLYRYGFSCQYITDQYADGFPRTWTVLPSAAIDIKIENGARVYRGPDDVLDARRIVQIDRNPTLAAHGTPAIRAYAQNAWGLLAAGNQSMTVNQGGIPTSVLKPQKKITSEQAQALQAQWAQAVTARNGMVPVLPPDLEFETLSFNPSDLALLETQEWNAKALATAFGIPSVLLNMALQGGLTYQNPGALGEMWWRFELRNTATRIANAFSAQMLPRGQWVSLDAADTFAELSDLSDDDDPQLSQVAKASPAQQDGAPTLSIVGREQMTVPEPTVRFEEGAIQVAAAPVPTVHVDARPAATRLVTFSDGTTATIQEEPAHVDQ